MKKLLNTIGLIFGGLCAIGGILTIVISIYSTIITYNADFFFRYVPSMGIISLILGAIGFFFGILSTSGEK